MKRTLAAFLITLVALTACGETEGAEDGNTENAPESHYTFWQDTPDGRVLCVWAKSGYGGGISCDWEHTR